MEPTTSRLTSSDAVAKAARSAVGVDLNTRFIWGSFGVGVRGESVMRFDGSTVRAETAFSPLTF